jgi:hypothetical protein
MRSIQKAIYIPGALWLNADEMECIHNGRRGTCPLYFQMQAGVGLKSGSTGRAPGVFEALWI